MISSSAVSVISSCSVREAVLLELLRRSGAAARSRASRAACSRGSRGSPCGRGAAAGSGRRRSPWRRTSRSRGRTGSRGSDRRTCCSARDRAPRAAPPTGSPRKSCPILSTSSIMKTGLIVPAFFMPWMIWPGQRADVGAPVAADRGLVVHAAERDAVELAPERARDAAAERRLADAGRADEAEDRALLVLLQLADGEVLEDALLDLLEAVVVLVEDLAHAARCRGCPCVELRPRQVEDPVEVGAHDRVLGRADLHRAQALELLLRDLLGLGRAGSPWRCAPRARRDRPDRRRPRRALP